MAKSLRKPAAFAKQRCHAPDCHFLAASPWAFIALGFGLGLSPVWPGTVGSLLGLGLAWLLLWLPLYLRILLIGGSFVIGIWACERTGRELASPDARAIVWDEVVGMAAVYLLAPPGVAWSVVSFIAFRLFDILKPWPISFVDQQLRNGFGVMLDDALAAAYAIAAVASLNYAAVEFNR